jgi:hypothetical protein
MNDDATSPCLRRQRSSTRSSLADDSRHEMGAMMARMVLARSDRPEIEGLARTIVTTQTAEVEQMREWYQDWYE